MKPTQEDYRRWAIELVERTTKAQGIPSRISDPVTIARVAVLLAPSGSRTSRHSSSGSSSR